MKNKLLLIPLIGAALLLTSCVGPRLEILSQQTAETVEKTYKPYVDDGFSTPDPGTNDYAIKYTVQVRNKGWGGKVRAMAKLYTSEGQFYREQIVDIESKQDKTLEFIFTEPTVAGGILGGVSGESKVRAEFNYELVQ